MRSVFITFVVSLGAGCGGNTVDADAFATMQACFDEHHVTEGLSINDAIVVCCLDHPLGTAMSHPSCKNSIADCTVYLNSDPVGMLTLASASAGDIQTACTDYISKKGM